jgi:glucokinase
MYVGVDVGGTKTLVAVLDEHGKIKELAKFPTPKSYDHFLLELRHTVAQLKTKEFQAGGAGLPGRIDRQHGRVIRFGNLTWKNVPAQADLERLLKCPVAIENDAKMAGISEAILLNDDYSKVLYVTISTGVGIALITNKVIDPSLPDLGGAARFIDYKGRKTSWDDYISGRAIVERYGQHAADIHDKTTWQAIARDMERVFMELIAIAGPDVIVIGGSVGTYFDRYGEMLAQELESHKSPAVTIPPLRKAQRPEEAVLYGCYELAKQTYGHADADS